MCIKSLRHLSLVVVIRGVTASSPDKKPSYSKCNHHQHYFSCCIVSFIFSWSSTDVKRKGHYPFMTIIADLPHFNTGRLTDNVSSDKA